MKMVDRQIVVITPVRNEAWVLNQFLEAASLFADHIVILDQMSVDGSREIAKSYPKVILIDNTSEKFNEKERQEILLKEARKLGSSNVLIALDADEIPSPTFLNEAFLRRLRTSDPGTVFQFDWLNLEPNCETAFRSPMAPIVFVDDGSPNMDNADMHRTRVPVPDRQKVIYLTDPTILHLQYVDQVRMRNKHIWYQVLEKATNPQKSSLSIYRTYHHMDSRVEKMQEKVEVAHFWAVRGVSLEGLSEASDKNPWKEQVDQLMASKPAHIFNDIETHLSNTHNQERSSLLRYARLTQGFLGAPRLNPVRLMVRAIDLLVIKFLHK